METALLRMRAGSVYTLDGGALRLGTFVVGFYHAGEARVIQNGGILSGISSGGSTVKVGVWASGTYELRGGELNAYKLEIGGGGVGATSTFIQTGGVCNAHVIIGSGATRYQLDAGTLNSRAGNAAGFVLRGADFLQNGGQHLVDWGLAMRGRYSQTGGSCTVDGYLWIASGIYSISGGSLATGKTTIGYDGSATLEIASAQADVTISGDLLVTSRGGISAVPGAVMHMTGSAFGNESTSPEDLSGLRNLTMIFEGGSSDIDPFELAGEDKGAMMEGLDSNFALGTLQLGGADMGWVQLVDTFDNQPDWSGTEALYVENLILGADSTLDLNGLNLYYRNFSDHGGTILNGTPTGIPMQVGIDVKPGSDPNPINLRSRGVVPVAILGSETFDVNDIDQTSLCFEGSALSPRGQSGAVGTFTDINADSYLDLMVRFPTPDMDELTGEDLYGELTGVTTTGMAILGTDLVKMVGNADANLDGTVDVLDLAAMANNFGASGATWWEGDFTGEGDVDVLDLSMLANDFGRSTPDVTAPIPEPTTLGLLGLGALALIRRRRQ